MLIETERLCICELEYFDWPDLLEIFTDFEQSPYHNYDGYMPTLPNDVKILIKDWVAAGNYYSVKLKDNSEAIGYICYHGEDIPEIGFAFKSKYQGCGYAFESITAWIKSSGFKRFTAGTAAANTPAIRLIERLGFKFIGNEELSFRKDIHGNDIKFIGNWYELNL